MASVSSDGDNNVALNVMPMLDIFSILILFLLMNFSSDPLSYEIHESVELPESVTFISLDEVPAIAVTKKDLLVNDHKIATINQGKLVDLPEKGDATISLSLELKKLSEATNRLKKADKRDEVSSLTVEMDKDHPFKILRHVMSIAQQSEFIKFNLMVSKPIE